MCAIVKRLTHGWVYRHTKRNHFFSFEIYFICRPLFHNHQECRPSTHITLLLAFQDVSGSACRHRHVPRHADRPPAQDKGNGGTHNGLVQKEEPSHVMPPHSHETLNTMLASQPCAPTCVPTPPDNFDTKQRSLFR